MATTNTTPKAPKFTKAMAYTLAIEVLSHSDHPDAPKAIEKLNTEIANLAKKSSGSGKPTKAQEANAILADKVAEFMADQPERLFTIAEISKECPAVLGATPQKIRPLLSNLIQQKQVERTEGKGGKPLFQFVGEVED